ncbi:MAG: hypothetical protein V4689_11790 [Verrucomicrobiota bacterium]
MAEKKRRRLIYKRAAFLKATGNANDTLESLLKTALDTLATAKSRLQNPGSSSEKRFINYRLLHDGKNGGSKIYGCDLLVFLEGEGQSAIKIDDKAAEFQVNSIPAEKGAEFLSGSVYFGVRQNHLIVNPSRSLGLDDLERYLNWILTVRTQVLAADNAVELRHHIAEKMKESFKKVKDIEISAPVVMTPSPAVKETFDGDEEAEKERRKLARAAKRKGEAPPTKVVRQYPVTPAGQAWGWLKSAMGSAFLPHEINVQNLADTPDLEIKLSLSWKGKQDENDSDFLDAIAGHLRHVDNELDFTIRGKNGVITREQVQLFDFFNVSFSESGQPMPDDIYPKMAEWLDELINDGSVDP